MTDPHDRYREWDAAYVIGSLSSSERREYEDHCATCADCSQDVASLAGISGILSRVPAEQATALLTAEVKAPGYDRVPDTLLPRFTIAARRARLRTQLQIGGLLAVAAAGVGIALFSTGVLGPDDDTRTVAMVQTFDSPITAEARLVPEDFGTTIEITCWYADNGTTPPAGAPQPPYEYALVVTDESGNETEQSTWLAGPGSVATPRVTTKLSVDEIASIDIRAVPFDDAVVLELQL